MFLIYNSILRGFGWCGACREALLAAEELWTKFKSTQVAKRTEGAGHKYSTTLHVLCNAIGKLHGVRKDSTGTRMYRGLGGLDLREFVRGR